MKAMGGRGWPISRRLSLDETGHFPEGLLSWRWKYFCYLSTINKFTPSIHTNHNPKHEKTILVINACYLHPNSLRLDWSGKSKFKFLVEYLSPSRIQLKRLFCSLEIKFSIFTGNVFFLYFAFLDYSCFGI